MANWGAALRSLGQNMPGLMKLIEEQRIQNDIKEALAGADANVPIREADTAAMGFVEGEWDWRDQHLPGPMGDAARSRIAQGRGGPGTGGGSGAPSGQAPVFDRFEQAYRTLLQKNPKAARALYERHSPAVLGIQQERRAQAGERRAQAGERRAQETHELNRDANALALEIARDEEALNAVERKLRWRNEMVRPEIERQCAPGDMACATRVTASFMEEAGEANYAGAAGGAESEAREIIAGSASLQRLRNSMVGFGAAGVYEAAGEGDAAELRLAIAQWRRATPGDNHAVIDEVEGLLDEQGWDSEQAREIVRAKIGPLTDMKWETATDVRKREKARLDAEGGEITETVSVDANGNTSVSFTRRPESRQQGLDATVADLSSQERWPSIPATLKAMNPTNRVAAQERLLAHANTLNPQEQANMKAYIYAAPPDDGERISDANINKIADLLTDPVRARIIGRDAQIANLEGVILGNPTRSQAARFLSIAKKLDPYLHAMLQAIADGNTGAWQTYDRSKIGAEDQVSNAGDSDAGPPGGGRRGRGATGRAAGAAGEYGLPNILRRADAEVRRSREDRLGDLGGF